MSKEKKVILAVDDSEDNLFIIKSFLCHEGYDVITASNGKEGLEVAKNDLPDIILTDLNMPAMDGFEFTKELKASEVTADIPIIMITAQKDTSSSCNPQEHFTTKSARTPCTKSCSSLN